MSYRISYLIRFVQGLKKCIICPFTEKSLRYAWNHLTTLLTLLAIPVTILLVLQFGRDWDYAHAKAPQVQTWECWCDTVLPILHPAHMSSVVSKEMLRSLSSNLVIVSLVRGWFRYTKVADATVYGLCIHCVGQQTPVILWTDEVGMIKQCGRSPLST